MKAWFQSKSLRERLLVTAFVFLLGLAWAITAVGRVRANFDAWKVSRNDLSDQQEWLNRQADIEQRSVEAVKNLDPTRTYAPTSLVATVSNLASQQGLGTAIDPPRTEQAPQFAYHTIRVTIRRAGLGPLLNFNDEIVKLSPYLSIDQINLQTDRAAPGMLNATLTISATQVLQN